MKLVSRASAIETGAVRYYTGVPCKHGHTAQRYTLSGACCECVDERAARDRRKIQEKRAALGGAA